MVMEPVWRVGIDIGGTFTDIVATDLAGGSVRAAKVPSVPGDPVTALVAALAAVDLTWDGVAELVHGTTMVTNDIVESRFSKTALVATEGFTDTLDIGRMSRDNLYRLDLLPKAPALVPDGLRFAVAERMLHDGAVDLALTEAEADRVAAAVAASGAESVAVCLLHAYRNPAHEILLGERLARVVPRVALSHRISPEQREYERMNTTVLSAAVMRRVQDYLGRIGERRPEGSRFHFFHSAGGMASIGAVADHPLMLAMSGPAAGVAASARIAAQIRDEIGTDQALTFDMGGTTTDVCLVADGAAQVRSDHRLGRYRIRLPILAVESIGAGGGSIARLDSGAMLVGPQSAGADPGPACYGRGGTDATVSDADLILGYLEPGRRLGNALTLDLAKAEAVVRPIADSAGVSVEDAALGIARVTHANMVRALRRITVERGVDGRSCPLIAFGGAGPMHAVEVARAYGIRTVVVPALSSGFSALGCVSARMRYGRQQTFGMASDAWDAAAACAARDAIIDELAAELRSAEGAAGTELTVEVVASLRYRGQSDAIELAEPDLDDPETLGAVFRTRHDALYGFSTDEPWELAALRVAVSGPEQASVTPAVETVAAEEGTRRCVFEEGGATDVVCLNRAALAPGAWRPGPAIIEDAWSTIVVPPGDRFRVDGFGHIHIEVAQVEGVGER